ncbi:hypothetical protein [Rhizobium laguerreae]|uniref:hypothetical protein n=1 Tax=Rhizobium laguerreae TaxID=1076926 RepID=UPI00147863A6|nr:hypothetical protein [Rhizobium laguerreae]
MLFSWPPTALSRGFTPIFLLPGQIIRASQGVNGKSPQSSPDRRLNLLRSSGNMQGQAPQAARHQSFASACYKTDGSQGAIAFHQLTEIKRYFDRRY